MGDVAASSVGREEESGTSIKTFTDDAGREIQAVALVSKTGEIAGVFGDPTRVMLDTESHINELRQIKKYLQIMCLHLQAITGIDIEKGDVDP